MTPRKEPKMSIKRTSPKGNIRPSNPTARATEGKGPGGITTNKASQGKGPGGITGGGAKANK